MFEYEFTIHVKLSTGHRHEVLSFRRYADPSLMTEIVERLRAGYPGKGFAVQVDIITVQRDTVFET